MIFKGKHGLFIIAAATIMWASCNDTPVIQPAEVPDIKENLINANKYIAHSEETSIDGYVARRHWQMQRLTCGARYTELSIDNNGTSSAKPITYEDTVTIHYDIETLTGTMLYKDESETVVVGRNEVPVGLDAVLRQLHHGSNAIVIVPSEAGYGVRGDGDRIPSRTILLYHLHID